MARQAWKTLASAINYAPSVFLLFHGIQVFKGEIMSIFALAIGRGKLFAREIISPFN